MPTSPDSPRKLAADLRALRHAAGYPTLASLSAKAHVSKSVLSDAFTGRRLPSATTLARVTAALGDGDSPAWVRRRDALAAEASAPTKSPPHSPSVGRTRARRHKTTIIIALILAAAAAAGALIANHAAGAQSQSAHARRVLNDDLPPINGAHPEDTRCTADATALAHASVEGEGIDVWLYFSPTCEAFWGRVASKEDEGEPPDILSLSIFPEGDRYGGQARASIRRNGSTVTRLILASVVHDGVCVSTSWKTPEGPVSQLASPLCVPTESTTHEATG